MSDIRRLKSTLREIGWLESTRAVLHWDQETYMPGGGGEFRAKQIAYLSTLIHKKITGQKFKNLLAQFADLENGQLKPDGGSDVQRRMLEETYRDYKLAAALPPDFVGELAEHASQSAQVWQEARKRDDFSHFQPYLQKMVKLQKQKAEYLGYEDKPLDALLDLYEPGMSTEKIKSIFKPVKERLIGLAQKIRESKVKIDGSFLHKDYPQDKQYQFSLKLLEAVGYNFNHGREDKSAHPFTTGFHPTDTRLTIRFDENDLASSIGAAIHEGGHALYEQGLNPEEFGNPLGQAISFGVHESQSRLWENLVGRSKPFWEYWLPQLKNYFPEKLKGVDLEEWYRAYNKVEPSTIRVQADEVHYNLHILLRLEIEDQLINGDLPVSKLPQVWNAKMKDYIGIKPERDAQGVLQDIHWSWGQFGYFPTYSLGNFYGVQIFYAALEEIPDLYELMRGGELSPLKEWLNQNIHQKGREVKAAELIADLCGEKPSSKPFMDYIDTKYSQIYSFQ